MLQAKRLIVLRKERGLTQKDVASHFGLERSTYGKYENSSIQPPPDMVVKLANYFNVSTDYLLGKSDVPNAADPPDFSEYLKQLNPLTGKKMTSREKKQLSEVLNSTAEALFYDDEIDEHDKEEIIQALNETFWMAKKMNRRKKPTQDENM